MAHEHVIGHASPDDEYRETPAGSTYEHTDASVRIIVKFLMWLAVSAVVIHVGLGFLYALLIERSMERGEPRYPMAAAVAEQLPPAPRLQQFPHNDLYEFRMDEERLLEHYGWMNKDAGIVHIPIEQARRLPLERRVLSSRPSDTGRPPTVPGLMPSDASAGRVMERRRQ